MNGRKGLGLKPILLLILALLFASFMGVMLTESPLAEAIKQGADLTEKRTEYTIEIDGETEEEAEKKLSDLAMLVFHRGSNDGCKEYDGNKCPGKGPTVCKQNRKKIDSIDDGLWNSFGPSDEEWGEPNQAGYPSLADTYLTEKPACYGTSSTAARGPTEGLLPAVSKDSGHDMEGIFSREKFEIPEDGQKIVVGDDRATWLDRNFLAASKKSFEQMVITEKQCKEELSGILADIDPSGSSDPRSFGTFTQFIVFFSGNVDDNRFNLQWVDENPRLVQQGLRTVYCQGEASAISFPGAGTGTNPVFHYYGSKNGQLTFCPGDKGYIQLNKGVPKNSGEASETITGGDKYYLYIQVTESGECVDADYSGNVDGSLDVTFVKNDGVLNRADEIKWEMNVQNGLSREIEARMRVVAEDGQLDYEKTKNVAAGGYKGMELSSAGDIFAGGGRFDGYDADEDFSFNISLSVRPAGSNRDWNTVEVWKPKPRSKGGNVPKCVSHGGPCFWLDWRGETKSGSVVMN